MTDLSISETEADTIYWFSQYFWPEETATAHVLSGIAFYLSGEGAPITAIAGQPAYHRNQEMLPRVMEHEGVTIRRVRSTRMDKNKTLGRIINTATFALAALSTALFARRPRAFVAVTNPPLLLWVVAFASLIRGCPCVLIIHDVYPQIATAIGKIRAGGLIDRLWQILNRWSYRRATRVITLGQCMTNVIEKDLPGRGDVIRSIPNWADGRVIVPREREGHPVLSEWGLGEAFVVQYSGNIGLFHELKTVIEAAEILANDETDGSEAQFLLIGEGGQRHWIRDHIEETGLQNVTLMPFQRSERLPLSLTACDAALVTLRTESTGLCVPSKLYGAMAAGCAILCVAESHSETARTVQQAGCGFVVEPGDANGLADAIRTLAVDRDRCAAMGKAARKSFEQHFDLPVIAGRYAQVFEELK